MREEQSWTHKQLLMLVTVGILQVTFSTISDNEGKIRYLTIVILAMSSLVMGMFIRVFL